MLIDGYEASESVMKDIAASESYREHIEKCVLHFVKFVYPTANHSQRIVMMYPITAKYDNISEGKLLIIKELEKDKVYLDYSRNEQATL